MRPIDADALIVSRDWENCVSPAAVIHKAPTLTLDDLRPKGRWEPNEPEGDVWFHCSECGTEISTSWDYDCDEMWNYCPSCGADMRK